MFICSYLLDAPSGRTADADTGVILQTIHGLNGLTNLTHINLNAISTEIPRCRPGLISISTDVEPEILHQPGRGTTFINYTPDSFEVSHTILRTLGECTPKALYVFTKKVFPTQYNANRNHSHELKTRVAQNILGHGCMLTVCSSKSPYIHFVNLDAQLYISILYYKQRTLLLFSDHMLDIQSDETLKCYNIACEHNRVSLLLNGIYLLSKFKTWKVDYTENSIALAFRIERYIKKLSLQGKL